MRPNITLIDYRPRGWPDQDFAVQRIENSLKFRVGQRLLESQVQKLIDEDWHVVIIPEKSEVTTKQKRIAETIENLRLALNEVEILKEELESWRDGLQGTNLENSNEELETAIDMLETGIDNIEAGIGDLEDVEFPQAYC